MLTFIQTPHTNSTHNCTICGIWSSYESSATQTCTFPDDAVPAPAPEYTTYSATSRRRTSSGGSSSYGSSYNPTAARLHTTRNNPTRNKLVFLVIVAGCFVC